jgi:hypothetical protein
VPLRSACLCSSALSVRRRVPRPPRLLGSGFIARRVKPRIARPQAAPSIQARRQLPVRRIGGGCALPLTRPNTRLGCAIIKYARPLDEKSRRDFRIAIDASHDGNRAAKPSFPECTKAAISSSRRSPKTASIVQQHGKRSTSESHVSHQFRSCFTSEPHVSHPVHTCSTSEPRLSHPVRTCLRKVSNLFHAVVWPTAVAVIQLKAHAVPKAAH